MLVGLSKTYKKRHDTVNNGKGIIFVGLMLQDEKTKKKDTAFQRSDFKLTFS